MAVLCSGFASSRVRHNSLTQLATGRFVLYGNICLDCVLEAFALRLVMKYFRFRLKSKTAIPSAGSIVSQRGFVAKARLKGTRLETGLDT